MYERVKITDTGFLKIRVKFLKFLNMILKFMSGVHKIRGFIFLKKVSSDHSIIIQGVVRRRGNVADRHYLYELRINF